MKSKLKNFNFSYVLMFIPVYLLLYTFLHEGGHALVTLAYGGKIDRFVLGLNAHINSHGASFSMFGEALNHAAGMILPTITGILVICFYNPKVKFIGYHIWYFAGSIGIASHLLAWIVIPIISLFTKPPQGDDVTNFLNVTGIPPLLVSAGALFLMGIIVFLAYKKGIFGILKKENEFTTSLRKNGKISFKTILIIIISGLFFTAVIIFLLAINNGSSEPVVFSTSFVVDNAFEEKNWECTFDVEETKTYSVDLSMKAQGFITALRIIDENGELCYQNLGEDFSFTMRIGLDKGSYTLSLTFLADYKDVESFFKSTGQEEISPESIQYFNETFNRNKNNYFAAFSIQIQ